METRLADFIRDTPHGREADAILRACVHCGFCTATCPTYQLLGDELDGPRGRIYQIKQVLEGLQPDRSTRMHLDRCLTCRSCETTCPSGVRYSRLLDIGRAVVAEKLPRPLHQRLLRWSLRKILTVPGLFAPMLSLGQMTRGLQPAFLREKVPPRQKAPPIPAPSHSRKVILAEGCVQPAYKPATNASLARILHRAGIDAIRAPGERCCGAVSFHLDAEAEALDLMRANIDAWWPHIEAGAEAIISSASGCGVMIKDYARALEHDPQYVERAATVSGLCLDAVEFLSRVTLAPVEEDSRLTVAFQSPCTLQHGQQLAGRVEALLSAAGHTVVPVPDSHMCCGSAGTYSILQKSLSMRLRDRKISCLMEGNPDAIATANIGCQLHLENAARVPVRHWVELLDDGAGANPDGVESR
ncbi:MAG: glycolate oxidase subunit GlcF [Gammaproteobacteria bacterium]|nr:glycolate oxidase subunit GlcF [Gammaproteobacteria bacterium]